MKIYLNKKEDGLVGIWQTMYTMRNLIKKSILNRDIKDFTVSLLTKANVSATDLYEQIKTIFNYIKAHTKYVRDIAFIEEIQTPHRLISNLKKYNFAYGDCDDMAVLSASMLYSIGFIPRLVVIATKPNTYNHVRTEILYNGKWLPLELTSNKSLGEKFYSYKKPLELVI